MAKVRAKRTGLGVERIGFKREGDVLITPKGFRYALRIIKPSRWRPKRFWWLVWRMKFPNNEDAPKKGVYISIGAGIVAFYRGF